MSKARWAEDGDWLRAILSAIPELVVVLDGNDTIVYLNRAEPGYRPEDFIGVSANELMPPESQGVHAEALEALRRTGEAQEYEVEAVLPGDVRMWYRSRMVAFGFGDDPDGVLLIGRNVTDLKAREEEVSRLKRLLPICSWCDRIQSSEGEWETVETHLEREGGKVVSHALCPDCASGKLGLADSG